MLTHPNKAQQLRAIKGRYSCQQYFWLRRVNLI